MDPDLPPPPPPSPEARELALAYLQVLMENRTPLAVSSQDGVVFEARIDQMDAARNRMVLVVLEGSALGMDNNDPLSISFHMLGNRWVGATNLYLHADHRRRLTVRIPKEILPGDRRQKVRVALSPEEGVQASLSLEALEWTGHGRVADVSEHGCRLILPRAVAGLHHEEGQSLTGTLRIEGLREVPMTFAARTLNVHELPEGLSVGIRFRSIPVDLHAFLHGFVQQRALKPPEQLPPLEAPAEAAAEQLPAVGDDRQASLLRLKKRLRSILVAAAPGPGREALVGFLRRDGYVQIHTPGTLEELARILRSPVHLAIVEGSLGNLEGLDLARFIRAAQGDAPGPILLVAEASPPGFEAEARASGIDQLLAPGYLEPAFTRRLEKALGLGTETAASEAAAPPAPEPRLRHRLALVMPPGPARDTTAAFLKAAGFSQVHPAGTLPEVAALRKAGPPALALVDWPEAEVPDLDLLAFLRLLPFDPPIPCILAADLTPSLARVAPGLGAVQLVARPYHLNPAWVERILQALPA